MKSETETKQLIYTDVFQGTGDDLTGLLTNENFQSPQCEVTVN